MLLRNNQIVTAGTHYVQGVESDVVLIVARTENDKDKV